MILQRVIWTTISSMELYLEKEGLEMTEEEGITYAFFLI